MLLFLKNLYIEKLFYAALVLFLHCTLYKCNSIIPQVSTVENKRGLSKMNLGRVYRPFLKQVLKEIKIY